MKKILLILTMVLGMSLTTMARDTYAHDASVLPAAAKNIVSRNFKATVSVVKIEKSMGRVSEYEVTLTDGTEISFDRDGNWKNVETARDRAVPAGFVPKAVSDYVAKKHPGTRIVGIEKERKGYEIELSDGIDMKFDKEGRFLRYDK